MARDAHAPLYCNTRSADGYHRHRPEQSALYKIIQAYWPQFAERAESVGGLRDFVKREFEAYLDCGILERGFVSVSCPTCGFERLVAFSLLECFRWFLPSGA